MAEDSMTHESPLHTAARQGNVDEVKQLLKTKQFNVESRNSENQTPLHLACANGHLDTVALLLYEFHADMRPIDNDGYTPLLLAAKNGHVPIVMMLIMRAYSDVCTSKKIAITRPTNIHYDICKVKSCHHKMLEDLILRYSHDCQTLEETAQMILKFFNHYVNYQDKSFFPLFLAASLGLKNLMDNLVISGFNLNVKGFFGISVLHCACFEGHTELVKSLISEHGVDYKSATDKNGSSVLHYAAAGGSVGTISLLVDIYGMSVECLDNYKSAPINSAACYGRVEAVQHLMNRYQCNTHTSGWSLIHSACKYGHVALIDLLVQEHDLDPSSSDEDSNTPLHIAAMKGQLETVKHLVNNHRANVNDTNKNGFTPLILAALNGRVEVICMLIEEYNCNPHTRNHNGYTLLHYACQEGHIQLVDKLVTDYKLNSHAKDDNGDTPLHIAAMRGQLETVRHLIDYYKANANDINKHGFTPLMFATLKGNIEVVCILIEEYNCNPHSKRNYNGRTLPHYACQEGHIQMIDKLVTDYKLDPMAKDDNENAPLHIAAMRGQIETVRHLIINYKANINDTNKDGSTPLMLAALNGRVEVVYLLIKEYKCNPYKRDYNGYTLLHYACQKGHIQMMEILINEFKVDPLTKNDDKDTPLHIAARNGRLEIVRCLINNHKTNINDTNKDGHTPLMLAALNGRVDMVHLLIEEHNCNPYERDYNGYTLLHYACQEGHIQMMDKLINEYKLDPKTKDNDGNTPLHIAARNGQLETVTHLVGNYEANINDINKNGSTPFILAALNGKVEVVRLLIEVYNCNPYERNRNGHTLLHHACQEGHIQVVDVLIVDYKLDPQTKDNDGYTPLHIATINGQVETVRHLINNHKTDMNDINTLLMLAAQNGRSELIHTLIEEFNCNPHEKNCEGYTLSHYACLGGHLELVKNLSTEYNIDLNIRDNAGNTPLHCECFADGDNDTIEKILSKYPFWTVFQSNNDGNTPLHIAAQNGKIKSVQLLLNKNAPLFVRNKQGKTPLDLAKTRGSEAITALLKTESRSSTVQQAYQELYKLAAKEFVGKKHLSRLFVVGHPGAGKSTLIETIKKEGLLKRFITTTVEPHTAGIVPSTYDSNDYGRIIFYDFAGDLEYYSSHAAIMESIDKSKGMNMYLVVCDLSKGSKDAVRKYSYWLSFLHCNIQKQLSNTIILPVGSHADLTNKESPEQVLHALNEVSEAFCSTVESFQIQPSVALDCRKKGATVDEIKKLVKAASSSNPPVELAPETAVLFGMLRRDFDNVPACKFKLLMTHIKKTGIPLPSTAQALYSIVKELHDLGLLMIIEKEGEVIENSILILNISEFTSDVHKKVFSTSAKQKFEKCTNRLELTAGIIPKTLLERLLPEYITKESLLKLQYCQEVENVIVEEDHTLTQFSSEQDVGRRQIDSLLFFPALCNLKLENFEWPKKLGNNISLGWYAKCADERFDYFPTRFHHVLTVHLSMTFALKQSLPASHKLSISEGSSTDDKEIISSTEKAMLAEVHACNPRCRVWSTGLHWLNNGVEVFVDLPSDADNKELIVVVRSSSEHRAECANMLRRVVHKIIEAKAEFCHNILPTIYLFDPTKLQRVPFTHARNVPLYALSDIEKVQTKGPRKFVTSVDGNHCAASEDLTHLTRWTMTYWSLLFPIDTNDVEYAIEEVIENWKCFGLNLGLSKDVLDAIDMDFPKVADKKSEMIQTWMTGCTMPTWSAIVEAFLSPSIDLQKAAEIISKKHNVPLQNIILDKTNSIHCPNEDFLQSFAAVINPRWQCLASPLSLTSEDIVSIKRDTRGAEPTRQALTMLQRWAAKETATYGQLRERLFSPGLYNLNLSPSYI